MTNPYFSDPTGTAPATRADDATKSDTTDLAEPIKSLKVGGAGNVKFIATRSDAAVTWVAQAGEVIPVAMRRIYSTGTTATGLIALRD